MFDMKMINSEWNGKTYKTLIIEDDDTVSSHISEDLMNGFNELCVEHNILKKGERVQRIIPYEDGLYIETIEKKKIFVKYDESIL